MLSEQQYHLVQQHITWAARWLVVKSKGCLADTVAEELARQALERAVRKFDPYKGRSFQSYALRYLLGAYCTYVKEMYRHTPIERHAAQSECAVYDTAADDREARLLLKLCLMQLHEVERFVVESRALEQRNYSDIARQLHVSSSTVWRIYHTALDKLRKLWNEL